MRYNKNIVKYTRLLTRKHFIYVLCATKRRPDDVKKPNEEVQRGDCGGKAFLGRGRPGGKGICDGTSVTRQNETGRHSAVGDIETGGEKAMLTEEQEIEELKKAEEYIALCDKLWLAERGLTEKEMEQ